MRRLIVLVAAATALLLTAPPRALAGGGAGMRSARVHAPSWARTVNVTVRDDSGRVVKVTAWQRPKSGGYASHWSCSNRSVIMTLLSRDVDIGIEVDASTDCTSLPSQGTIRVSFFGDRNRRATFSFRYDGPGGIWFG